MTETEAVPLMVTDLDGEPIEVLVGADVAYVTEYRPSGTAGEI